MKHLTDIIKNLPNNLMYLELGLYYNKLGGENA